MKHNLIDSIIFWLVLALVGTVFWILILAAAIHVFGCSVSLEVESEMHHQESSADASTTPTPTPAARSN